MPRAPVPALEPLRGLHVVADPVALDAARWSDETRPSVTVLRFAPDEAFAIGVTADDVGVADADPDAIVVEEHGFVGAWCSLADVGHHIEWPLPTEGPALLQGAVAGVPAKLWMPGDRAVILLVTPAPYATELTERLGWNR
jgi:hypothetical protein